MPIHPTSYKQCQLSCDVCLRESVLSYMTFEYWIMTFMMIINHDFGHKTIGKPMHEVGMTIHDVISSK